MQPAKGDSVPTDWDLSLPVWFRHSTGTLGLPIRKFLDCQPKREVPDAEAVQRKVPMPSEAATQGKHELFPDLQPLAEDIFAGEERLALARLSCFQFLRAC